MSVATHLKIDLAEYDERIRTFIPSYDRLIAAAAEAAAVACPRARVIVDLGVGTGALAERCRALLPSARVVGIDIDPAMLDAARQRLAVSKVGAGGRKEGDRTSGRVRPDERVLLILADLERTAIPSCDAIVASLALHHVRTLRAKSGLYSRCRAALRPGGILVTADCFPPSDPRLADRERARWRDHLRATYTSRKADDYLHAWQREDVYFSLDEEVRTLQSAGFVVDVVWREGCFGVLAGIAASI